MAQVAFGKPTVFKVTVTKVEAYNGTSFVTIYIGSSQLDLVAAAGAVAFPGISSLTLPAGTYTQVRLTFDNAVVIKGALTAIIPGFSAPRTCYTTATTLNSNTASKASTSAAALTEATIANSSWGAFGDPVVSTFAIPSVAVLAGLMYAPTLKFDIAKAMVLNTEYRTFAVYFTLAPITVTLLPG